MLRSLLTQFFWIRVLIGELDHDWSTIRTINPQSQVVLWLRVLSFSLRQNGIRFGSQRRSSSGLLSEPRRDSRQSRLIRFDSLKSCKLPCDRKAPMNQPSAFKTGESERLKEFAADDVTAVLAKFSNLSWSRGLSQLDQPQFPTKDGLRVALAKPLANAFEYDDAGN